jgi:predicted phage terminase large subunit-like protein
MWNVVPYEPKGHKEMRMMAQTSRIEGGRVYLPERASWKEAYLHELLTFPKGRYDDQVHSTSQALDYIKGVKPKSGAVAFNRQENEKRKLGFR